MEFGPGGEAEVGEGVEAEVPGDVVALVAEESFAVHAHAGVVEALLFCDGVAVGEGLGGAGDGGVEAGVVGEREGGVGEELEAVGGGVGDEGGEGDGVIAGGELVMEDDLGSLLREAGEFALEEGAVGIAFRASGGDELEVVE